MVTRKSFDSARIPGTRLWHEAKKEVSNRKREEERRLSELQREIIDRAQKTLDKRASELFTENDSLLAETMLYNDPTQLVIPGSVTSGSYMALLEENTRLKAQLLQSTEERKALAELRNKLRDRIDKIELEYEQRTAGLKEAMRDLLRALAQVKEVNYEDNSGTTRCYFCHAMIDQEEHEFGCPSSIVNEQSILELLEKKKEQEETWIMHGAYDNGAFRIDEVMGGTYR